MDDPKFAFSQTTWGLVRALAHDPRRSVYTEELIEISETSPSNVYEWLDRMREQGLVFSEAEPTGARNIFPRSYHQLTANGLWAIRPFLVCNDPEHLDPDAR